jgi:hypothetical protein
MNDESFGAIDSKLNVAYILSNAWIRIAALHCYHKRQANSDEAE